MKKLCVILCMMGLITFTVLSTDASAYDWYTYNGHSYTLTSDWSNWANAEAEAVSLGGHLVTINNSAENSWLSSTFQGVYGRNLQGDAWHSYVWIGYYPVTPGDWHWISGEVGTLDSSPPWWTGIPNNDYSPAYLHTDTHVGGGKDWNNYYLENTDPAYHAKGVIEITVVPEPISSILFITGGSLLAGRRYFRRGK